MEEMKNLRIKISLVLAIAAIAALVTQQVFAQTPGLNGKWVSGGFSLPDGNVTPPATYVFKVNGSQLTGWVEDASIGQVTIDDGRVIGDAFSFKIDNGGVAVRHRGTLQGDSCELCIDYQGALFCTTIKRATQE